MKTRLTLLAIVLLLGATALADPIPIGISSTYDSTTGKTSRSIGPGGEPTLNYQKDGVWDFIVDDWVQVGNKQIWKSVRGNHRVFADSTGAAIYAKGNHYLGTQTTHLIKFNKADSTWQTLKSSLPSSVTTSENTITFHNIFPGVDKSLRNNAKVLQQYAETFIFHQEARDTIATYGPWTGYLLGTATRLNVDSLNLSWKDAAGLFDITSAGRMTDGWIKGMDADTMVWTIAQTYLHTANSVTSIVVHKRVVLIGGNPYLVELFNPVPTASYPDGDIWHNATFGHTDAEANSMTIENTQVGMRAIPGSSGDADSITVYAEVTTQPHQFRCALTDWVSGSYNHDLIDTTAGFDLAPQGFGWVSRPLLNNQAIAVGEDYALVVWGEGTVGTFNIKGATTGEDSNFAIAEIYQSAWDDPLTPAGHGVNPRSIYCYYTEALYFGDYTNGGLGVNCDDAFYGGLFTLSESADVIGLTVYMKTEYLQPAHDCVLLIYDKDSTLMGKTEERSISGSIPLAWQYFDISGAVELSAGQYILGLSTDEESGACIIAYYDSPDTDSMCYKTIVADYYNYASPADPLLYTYLAGYQASIVCLYDVVEAPPEAAPKGRRRKFILGGIQDEVYEINRPYAVDRIRGHCSIYGIGFGSMAINNCR